jgi:phosphopantetheinyl transferase (holo-ACP synthase)
LKFTELSFCQEGEAYLIDVNSVLCVDAQYRKGFSYTDICALKADLDSACEGINIQHTYPSIFELPSKSGEHRGHQWFLSRSAVFYGLQENGLRQRGVEDLCVSISHSKEVALAALSARGNRVGVDVEKVDRNITAQAIRQVYNTEDIKGTDRLDVWLVKEAVFKASNGLISHLNSVAIVKQINDNLYCATAGGLFFMVCMHSIEGTYRVSIAVEFSDRKFF